MKLRNQILGSLIISGLVPLAVAFIYAILHSSNTTNHLVLETADNRLSVAAQTLAGYFEARQSEIELLATQPNVRSMDFMAMRPILMSALDTKNGIYEKFIVGRADGSFHNTAGGNPHVEMLRTFDDGAENAKPKSIQARDYWQQTVGDNSAGESVVYLSNPMISFTTEVKQIVVAATIRNKDHIAIGLLGGALPWENIQNVVNELEESLGEAFSGLAHFALISKDGTYWHHWEEGKIIHFKKDEQGEFVLDSSGEKQTVQTKIEDTFKSQPKEVFQRIHAKGGAYHISEQTESALVHHIFQPIGNTGYVLQLAIDDRALKVETIGLVKALILTLIIACLVALLWTVLLSKKLTTPLLRFESRIKDMHDGDLKPIEYHSTTKEFNQLFNEFNQLIMTVSENELTLKRSEERFAMAMRGANDGIWDWDILNQTVYFSPRWKQMVGYEDSELPNDMSTWQGLVFEEDAEQAIGALNQYLEGHISSYQTEFRMKHKDGHLVDVFARGFAAKDKQSGQPVRVVGTLLDISERKKQVRRIIVIA